MYSNQQMHSNESSHSQNQSSGSNKKKDRNRDRDKSMRNSSSANLSNSTKVNLDNFFPPFHFFHYFIKIIFRFNTNPSIFHKLSVLFLTFSFIHSNKN